MRPVTAVPRRPLVRAAAVMLAAMLLGSCGTSAPTGAPAASSSSVPSRSGDLAGPSASGSASASVAPSPAASATPSASPSATPEPTNGADKHDPAKFGFLAKGMTNEVMAFVTTGQLGYGADVLDLDVVSTVAFFSLEAQGDGHVKKDRRWTSWNSAVMDRLIANAHAKGTKVVLSLARFAWSPGQTRTAVTVLSSADRRELLARETADIVARRGVDGVNVDFEPIPRGQKANFTDFVHRMRKALDDIRAGYQLTFDVTGHYDSYDVGGALRAGGADAVYLMGYHYAGTWSKIAGSTSPFGGPRYDVSDTINSLLRYARPEQLIVGLPYYGHVWPTASSAIHSRTLSGGHDVQYQNSRVVAAQKGARWDPVEQVPWVLFRDRTCGTCRVTWFQLFYDDARSMTLKWNAIKKRQLLGTGMWTAAFEGGRRELTEAMRRAFLGATS